MNKRSTGHGWRMPLSLRNDVRQNLRDLFSKYLTTEMLVYDIGCRNKPFADFLEGRVKGYLGVDIDDGFYSRQQIDIVGSALNVPVADGAADAVISSQVIEHLEDPPAAIRESHRLLVNGGILFLSCPFLYPLHAAPRDYFRFTEHGVEQILLDCGFRILEKHVIGGFWYCMGSYARLYLKQFDRGIFRAMRIVRASTWIICGCCSVLQKIEDRVFTIMGRVTCEHHRAWAVNYVYVATKQLMREGSESCSAG